MWNWQRMRHKPLWALISLTVLLLMLDRVSQSQANTEPPAVETTTGTTTEPGEIKEYKKKAYERKEIKKILTFIWQRYIFGLYFTFCYKIFLGPIRPDAGSAIEAV